MLQNDIVSDINKVFACWHLYSTDDTRMVINDREYARVKYLDYDFSETFNYRELLESVGIEMGEVLKTLISGIFGLSSV